MGCLVLWVWELVAGIRNGGDHGKSHHSFRLISVLSCLRDGSNGPTEPDRGMALLNQYATEPSEGWCGI